jgi:O-acetyl-ADP-ribose deacetylase (regulator of RNase III)
MFGTPGIFDDNTSMIEFIKKGDLLKSNAEALVNTVNCVGVMGRGIALQFKKKFPENFATYKKACDTKELTPGNVLVVDMGKMFNPRYIINFPTKDHWRAKSRIEDIAAGLESLVAVVRDRKIKSIAIPPLGCGLGGLDWTDVRPLILRAFEKLTDVQVSVFEPGKAPAVQSMAASTEAPKMTAGRAALLGLMKHYLSAVMDPFVTLLELHKLMYFMQEFGEPLKLNFKAASYGPYAENLRHVLKKMEGHFIIGFGDGEDAPSKPIEPKADAIQEAERLLEEYPETQRRFRAVSDLISGFETPYGMELLSTVRWVIANDGVTSPEEAVAKVHAWNDRKKMFPPAHIELAWNVLAQHGLSPSP